MNRNTRLIPLTQGKFAIVSAEDYEFVTQWKWQARMTRYKNGSVWYAIRTASNPKKTILMHRVICQKVGLKSKYFDHKDRDGLNNTRDNLRPCTRSQNCANRIKFSDCSSKYKGVSRHINGWQSRIQFKGKPFYLGYFREESDARKAYESAAVKLFGEFACL